MLRSIGFKEKLREAPPGFPLQQVRIKERYRASVEPSDQSGTGEKSFVATHCRWLVSKRSISAARKACSEMFTCYCLNSLTLFNVPQG